jgi:hypothetical protein
MKGETMKIDELHKGDGVRYSGPTVNPRYAAAMGLGRVLSICDGRVRVKFEGSKKPRNYKAENLSLECQP